MLETLVAALALLFVFTLAHRLSRMVAAKTLLAHAASRSARAKAVGFNDFMCEKTARAAVIPVAGRRTWPPDAGVDEVSRVPIYLESEDWARANGVLDYEFWHSLALNVKSGSGVAPDARARLSLDAGEFSVGAGAETESHFPLYMFDQGR